MLRRNFFSPLPSPRSENWSIGRPLFAAACLFGGSLIGQELDVVFANGRVLDPESQLDAIRQVGIRDGKIAAVSTSPLQGKWVIDAKGLALAPGFIDLHQHAQAPGDYALKVQDGVTTVAELEVGAADVDAWYAEREGKTPIHFAVSVGHIPCRMQVMGDRPVFLPGADSGAAVKLATDAQINEIRALIERGLERGAVAVGFGLTYTPIAAEWEILEMFRTAARYRASCHVHIRGRGASGPRNLFAGLGELISHAAISGASAHFCHSQATSAGALPQVLQIVADTRRRGIDVTLECYPYTAGMTEIKSANFNPGWQDRMSIGYSDLQWAATGERLTAETFAKFREQGGLVLVYSTPEEVVRAAVAHPLTMIASDGIRGHPRHAGTSARVLGYYVRELQALPLLLAIEKLALMPARRLEARVPAMKNKGRIRVGADADLVVFDPATVRERATYEKPNQPSAGIAHVLVNGTFVVRDGTLQNGVTPGRAVRAPLGRK